MFNYFSLHYIVLALSSAVTKLPNKTLISHDFQGATITFQVFPGLEGEIFQLSRFSMTCTNPVSTGFIYKEEDALKLQRTSTAGQSVVFSAGPKFDLQVSV